MTDPFTFTNLDEPLFADAGASKGDLVGYLDAVRDRLIPDLRNRPLSVIRAVRGQPPFMQKNLPKYTPSWVRTVTIWSDASKREVSYALCNDRRTLLWLANQRAVEFHPALVRADRLDKPLFLVLDIDPPSHEGFAAAVRAAHLVRTALSEYGLSGAVKTSGSKGLHVFVPVTRASHEDVAAAARGIAARVEQLDPELATTAFMKDQRGGKVFIDATRVGGATVAAAYSPRVRARVPVSFPVNWDELDRVTPTDFTIHTAPRLAAERPAWTTLLPKPQRLPATLVNAGRVVPLGRVEAMHEGRRRARASRDTSG
ncbi:MAG TPA: non-homologous end-joining DNA ligase [Candidatus Acidoferrales bacterium]|nr:non-homologous end-joining DNA ligase [Candidatus Acidoferrales bacterium]